MQEIITEHYFPDTPTHLRQVLGCSLDDTQKLDHFGPNPKEKMTENDHFTISSRNQSHLNSQHTPTGLYFYPARVLRLKTCCCKPVVLRHIPENTKIREGMGEFLWEKLPTVKGQTTKIALRNRTEAGHLPTQNYLIEKMTY